MSADGLLAERDDPSGLLSIETMLAPNARHSAKRLEIEVRGVASASARDGANDQKLPLLFTVIEERRFNHSLGRPRHTQLPESLNRAMGITPKLTLVSKPPICRFVDKFPVKSTLCAA
jgi:hypothetical protein